jgi:hypothetical protein
VFRDAVKMPASARASMMTSRVDSMGTKSSSTSKTNPATQRRIFLAATLTCSMNCSTELQAVAV